jgi:predicted alpha/beta-hydrolase family hydrolase
MNEYQYSIQVTSDLQVTSVWAVPEGYQAGRGDAVILAHGAGNDMNHGFMCFFHRAFAEAGLLSVKFNFPYTEAGRKAPDRMPLLEATWRLVIDAVRSDAALAPRRLFLAGKSMGGRVASHVAAQGTACDGLIFLGYPLHAAGKPDQLRVEHWAQLTRPSLFVEGTRDPLCNLDTLRTELPRLSSSATLHVVEGGDHSFKVPKSAGITEPEVWLEVSGAVTSWIRRLA